MGFVATTLRMTAGILVWAVHFGAIYGFTSLACGRGLAVPVPGVVVAASVVAVTVLAAALAPAWRARRAGEFADRIALGLGGFALVAIAFETLAALMVPACA
jgi:hypothetical protein